MPDPAPLTATFESHPFHGARLVVPDDDDNDDPRILLCVGVEFPILLSEPQLAAIAAVHAQRAAIAKATGRVPQEVA